MRARHPQARRTATATARAGLRPPQRPGRFLAHVAAAALVVAVEAPAQLNAAYAGFLAVAVILAVNEASARGRLSPASAALAGFAAAALALVWASYAGVPGVALCALAVASLIGVAVVARRALDAVGYTLLAAAAASGGVALRGDLRAALVIAAATALAGAAVVLPIHALIFELAKSIRWVQRHEHAANASAANATSEELDEARAEARAARQALAQVNELRRAAEMQAIESIRTKEAFLAVMSHELRTPLSQILGYSEILLEESEDASAETLRRDVERIHLAGCNLLEILDNTLSLSSIEAGKVMVQVEALPLYDFLQELIDGMATAASQQENTLRLRCPQDIGVLRTDRVKLRKILGALLSNACKFTRNGTVRLAVHRDPRVMRFEVSDTGIGIPPDALGRLFEPFYQVDDSPTRRYGGAGLGLTLGKHLTTMLGGVINVTSELGRGSTFTLQLPLDLASPRDAGIVVMSVISDSSGMI